MNTNTEPALRRARLLVAYNGAAFHGFALTPGTVTVAQTLNDTIEQVIGSPVAVLGAGRTDAGVHAWGQVVHVDLADTADLDRLVFSVNSLLDPDIVIRKCEWVTQEFDARHSALWREYRYTVLNAPVNNPFLAATSWHIRRSLSVPLMQLATDSIIGLHDFSSFCRQPQQSGVNRNAEGPSMMRRVHVAQWHDQGNGILTFDIRANAFCHQMVRSIVGTLVDVGLGRRKAGEMSGVLRAMSRLNTPHIAPPQGLCLMDVGYPS
jgi:tRNA pseudouridine38-40 synthase